ncbi:hypothetical protein V8C40DRAFT_258325 [Trichoderma camerunense]
MLTGHHSHSRLLNWAEIYLAPFLLSILRCIVCKKSRERKFAQIVVPNPKTP